jgi:hypothetical protein
MEALLLMMFSFPNLEVSNLHMQKLDVHYDSLVMLQLIINNHLAHLHYKVLCELDGITCSNRGSCGPGVTGCFCSSPNYIGEYCHEVDEQYTSKATKVYSYHQLVQSFLFLFIVCELYLN